jgi:hypothetical protein
MARVAAAVRYRSLESFTLSLTLKPGIIVIDLGRPPSPLNLMVVSRIRQGDDASCEPED